MTRRLHLWLVALPLIAVGCSGIEARRASAPGPFAAWKASAVDGDALSPRTLQVLRSLDLEDVYEQNPAAALARLQVMAEKEVEPARVFALAEISYLLGRATEKQDCGACLGYYYLSAGYAYHYLFSGPDAGASPFDPRFRLACDLYNAGLGKCIRAAQRVGRLDSRQELRLPTCDRQGFTLSVVHRGFLWKPEEFGKLLLCEDYRAVGLENQYRTYGLGVPLIAVRSATNPDPSAGLYPPQVSFPVTAFFRFDGSLADLRQQRSGQLELHNPLTIQNVDVRGVTTPLETDLTTPLAYFLGQADLENVGYRGFLRPEQVQTQSGIYLVEPYQPGKIPVLFVHGLLSSPLTWATLFNDLRADPKLRERYQFWFYLYPTSKDYLETAADLRDALAKLRERLDPERRDRALDDMVLVGHSMGGLVSKLLTVDSGDAFWNLLSTRPFEELQASPADRAALSRIFFFQPAPDVKRVIFLGTPHHGSKLSPSLPGRILRYFVRMPKNLALVAQDVARANPGALTHLRPDKPPTSLDLLAPNAPALEVLAKLPRPAGVSHHSIIGLAPPSSLVWLDHFFAGKSEPGDGVVPLTSAHLDGVNSELIVPAEHTQVHHHPLAVQEVRRILLENVK